MKGEPRGIYRFDGKTGQFINWDGNWQTDNRRLIEITGIGGDVDWEPATKKEARAYIAETGRSVEP